MSFEVYKQKKEYVLNVMEQCKEKVSDTDLHSIIDDRIQSLEDNKFRIAVFGNFSVGKSKFLNALMGFKTEILKEDDLPCTATITKLVEAKPNLMNKVEVKFHDKEKREVIDLDELANFTSRNEEKDVEGSIEEVILNLKSTYLENGIEIIDTPGFNSTFKIHTDIAKSYVKKSDASIFLFDVKKAGTKIEFEFLRDVNEYINRVFFAMNKIDLCVQNNESHETLVRNLENNLINNNIDLHGKPIYPISAKKHHEGIMEESEDKIREGNFEGFTTALTTYLTSEENVKDRLYAPLHAIEIKLIKQREFCDEKLEICNQTKEKVQKIIKEKKIGIENLEKDLISKRKYVKNEVNMTIRNAVKEFDDLIPALKSDLKSITSAINSEFELELVDLPRLALSIYDDFVKCWNKVRARLEDDIEIIIDHIVDDEDKNVELRSGIMDKIHNSFGFDRIEIDLPPIDLNQVKKLDEQIEEHREEYEALREDLRDARSNELKYDEVVDAINRKKLELSMLEKNRDLQVNTIGYGTYQEKVETNIEKEKRDGLLGFIAAIFVGKKKVKKETRTRDDSDIKERKIIRDGIKRDYNSEIDSRESTVLKLLEEGKSINFDESDVEEIRKNLNHKQTSLLEQESQVSTEKKQMVQKIIAVNIQKFDKELDGMISKYSNDTREYLRKHRNTISRMIGEIINVDEAELFEKRLELQEMYFVSDKSPDELEVEANKIHKEIAETINVLEYIKESKEAI